VQQDTNIHLDLDAAAGSPETNMTWTKQQDPSSKFSKWLNWDSDESPNEAKVWPPQQRLYFQGKVTRRKPGDL